MRILLIATAFNSMTQRFYVELADNGYEVAVELYNGNEGLLKQTVSLFKPDLIFAPFLTPAIPEEICSNYVCIIVHPGVEGDRGPSSLDWAIQERFKIWGVTLLQATAEMDAGPVWASRIFPLRRATKSSVYRREVIEAAVECLWEVIDKFDRADFKPRTVDSQTPGLRGKARPLMKQSDRRIDWSRHTTDEILARIHAGDGVPGVLDQMGEIPVYPTTDKLVISALASNAGAGGAILPLAADFVVCRDGVVLNPHYKSMGWLYGSEYWTYLLPRRVGWDNAIEITENCLPVSAKRAKQIGLIDEVMHKDRAIFAKEVHEFVMTRLSATPSLLLAQKKERLKADERKRPLMAYRTHELRQMYKNFYVPNSPYHLARQAFVMKKPACWSPVSVRAPRFAWSKGLNEFGAGCVTQ
jgi:methionyl-tRNA formyltransferase